MPWTEHDEDEEVEVQPPQIRIATPPDRTFVVGDEFYVEVESIADVLLDRGADVLAGETLDWLQGVAASARARRS